MLLKLPGEGLAGERSFRIHPGVLDREVHEAGAKARIVLGGGNVIRDMSAVSEGIGCAQADSICVLASIRNGMARQDALERRGLLVRLQSAPEITRAAPSPTSAGSPPEGDPSPREGGGA